MPLDLSQRQSLLKQLIRQTCSKNKGSRWGVRQFLHWLCCSCALIQCLLRPCDQRQLKALNQSRSRVQGQLSDSETMTDKERQRDEGSRVKRGWVERTEAFSSP